MCYHYSLKATKKELEKQYSLTLANEVSELLPITHVSAFNKQKMPVVTTAGIQLFHWGLVPYWAKKIEQDFSTYNAKAEGIHNKPTWKLPIASQRCLVPATGFFEWRHEGKQKYPYYINLKNQSLFSFAGIWDQWIDPVNSGVHFSFSIITTPANKLMRKIHNSKKRMPLILNKKDESAWVDQNSSAGLVQNILGDSSVDLHGITVQKNFVNQPDNEKLTAWEYPELSLIDLF